MNGDVFTINIVGDHNNSYLKHFWLGYDPEKHVFDSVAHEITEEGAVAMTDAKSSILCRRVQSSMPGDHEVVIAEVIGSVVHNEKVKPQMHVRKTGLNY